MQHTWFISLCAPAALTILSLCTYAFVLSHTHARARAHTHTHTYTHALSLSLFSLSPSFTIALSLAPTPPPPLVGHGTQSPRPLMTTCICHTHTSTWHMLTAQTPSAFACSPCLYRRNMWVGARRSGVACVCTQIVRAGSPWLFLCPVPEGYGAQWSPQYAPL